MRKEEGIGSGLPVDYSLLLDKEIDSFCEKYEWFTSLHCV